MRNMTGKAKMMVIGIALGVGTAALLAVLTVSGRLGGWGILAVFLLMGLAGLGGWIIGIQMRVKLERDKVWLEGYKEGRGEWQERQRMGYCHVVLKMDGLGQ